MTSTDIAQIRTEDLISELIKRDRIESAILKENQISSCNFYHREGYFAGSIEADGPATILVFGKSMKRRNGPAGIQWGKP